LAIIAITIRYENFFVCVSIIENIDNRTSIYEIVIKKSCITLLSIIGNMKIKANIDINRKILLSSPKLNLYFFSCHANFTFQRKTNIYNNWNQYVGSQNQTT